VPARVSDEWGRQRQGWGGMGAGLGECSDSDVGYSVALDQGTDRHVDD
jgi:hypothetical protein